MAKPQVEVEQAQPQVRVQQAEPQVRIQQAQPQVNVERQRSADVQIAGRQPLDETSDRLQGFIGRDVVARSGDRVGRVSDLLIAPGGGLDAVIVKLADAMGGQQVQIPADDVMVNSQDGTVLVMMDPPRIAEAPAFDTEAFEGSLVSRGTR
jgi:sporulation protein YlmC with PRC-barrel domain